MYLLPPIRQLPASAKASTSLHLEWLRAAAGNEVGDLIYFLLESAHLPFVSSDLYSTFPVIPQAFAYPRFSETGKLSPTRMLSANMTLPVSPLTQREEPLVSDDPSLASNSSTLAQPWEPADSVLSYLLSDRENHHTVLDSGYAPSTAVSNTLADKPEIELNHGRPVVSLQDLRC